MKRALVQPAPAHRILLVNDNRNGLLARKAVLEQAGHTVAISTDPQEALANYQESPFDLVVTHYRMKGMTAQEFIGELRTIDPNARVIVVSGVAEVLGLNAENTGADAIIPKSANEVSHLLRTVARLLKETKAVRKPVKRAPEGSKSTSKGRGTVKSGS